MNALLFFILCPNRNLSLYIRFCISSNNISPLFSSSSTPGSGRPSSTQGVYSGYEAGASPLAGYSPSTPQATPLTSQSSSSLPRNTKSSSPPSTAQATAWSNPHIRQVVILCCVLHLYIYVRVRVCGHADVFCFRLLLFLIPPDIKT